MRRLVTLIVTIAWSWAWWLGAAALGGLETPAGLGTWVVGSLGPLVGTAAAVRAHPRLGGRDLLRRTVDLRPLLRPVSLLGVAAVLAPIVAGVLAFPTPDPELAPLALLGVVGFALAAGVVEEPAWRGAALDELSGATGPLTASLVIGAAWAVWHLPLYLVAGTFQAEEMILGSAEFWLNTVGLFPLTVVMVGVVLAAGRSVAVAAVLHAVVNIAGEVTDPGPGARLTALVLTTLIAVAVVWSWRRGPADQPRSTGQRSRSRP